MTRRKSYQKGTVEMHNGQWSVRFREYDHVTREWGNKRIGLGFHKGKKSAQKAAEPIMSRVNERNNATSLRMLHHSLTFSEFINTRWRPYTVTAKHRQTTIDKHDSHIKIHLLPYFGKMMMAEITPGSVTDFFDQRRRQLSGNTLASLYRLLRLMFEIATQYEVIQQSPVRSLMHRPEPVEVDKPTLTPEQIRAVMEHLSEQERLYLILLAITGIRMSEGLALRWCDFDGPTMTVNHSLYKGELKPTKTKKSRSAYRLHPYVVGLLLSHREMSFYQAPDDFVFTRPEGLPVSQEVIRKHFHKAMDKVGIERKPFKHGFHILRHSAASLLYDKVRDLKQVQSMLRHSTIATTANIYVHPDSAVVTEGTDLLTEAILGDLLENCALGPSQKSEMVS